MTSTTWDEARIQQYIDDQTQENLTLEYKRANALVIKGEDKKKNELIKDVSAMANSAGGVIIYGIAEYSDEKRRHLPEKIEPIDQTVIRREWLDHTIADNIHPRIDGIIIHPVPIGTTPNQVVYVVEIPQSTTAHQSIDKKYYKRFNFISEAMEDYEIRDVMGRSKYPHIQLNFEIHLETRSEGGLLNPLRDHPRIYNAVVLKIFAKNKGQVFAQYLNGFFYLPKVLIATEIESNASDYESYVELKRDNFGRILGNHQIGTLAEIYTPVLPDLSHSWQIRLNDNFSNMNWDNYSIEWKVYADNSPVVTGKITVKEIPVIDQRG